MRIDASAMDASVIESQLLRWLDARRWRPIAFGDDVAAFLSEDGVSVRVERSVSGDGRTILRLLARRQAASLTAEMLFEVDEATHWPRLYRVSLESMERTVEFVLAAEKVETVGPGAFQAVVFEPDVPQRPSVPPAQRPNWNSATPVGVSSVPDSVAMEIQTHYALHRSQACMGEAIAVVPRPEGRVTIRGLVPDAARRKEIVDSARGLAFADIAIRTYDEALRERDTLPGPPETQRVVPDIQVRGSQIPAEAALRRYFAGMTGGANPATVAQYATQVVSASAHLLAHAWALQKLAEAFPPEKADGVPPPAAWLLENMVRDHTDAAADSIGESLTRLAPVLRNLTGAVGEPPGSVPDGESDWRGACRSLHTRAEKIDRLTRSLFSVSGTSDQPPEDLATALWTELSSTSRNLRLLRWPAETAPGVRLRGLEAGLEPPKHPLSR